MRDLKQVTKSINQWSETLINTRHKISTKKNAQIWQNITNRIRIKPNVLEQMKTFKSTVFPLSE